jgi:hypothetical protein
MALTTLLLQLATAASLQVYAPTAPVLAQQRLGVSAGYDSAGKHSRPRPIEVSDSYALRLKIHRYGSYAMLPLFATQFTLGTKLLNEREDIASGARTEPVNTTLRRAHLFTALGIGTLFVSNTTTGLWNLYDNRKNPEHRGIRTAHVLTMLLADAGFVITGRMGVNGKNGTVQDTRRHHNVALGSMGVATIGASMMWFLDH